MGKRVRERKLGKFRRVRKEGRQGIEKKREIGKEEKGNPVNLLDNLFNRLQSALVVSHACVHVFPLMSVLLL